MVKEMCDECGRTKTLNCDDCNPQFAKGFLTCFGLLVVAMIVITYVTNNNLIYNSCLNNIPHSTSLNSWYQIANPITGTTYDCKYTSTENIGDKYIMIEYGNNQKVDILKNDNCNGNCNGD